MQFRSFEDIIVWQESRKLVRAIRTLCKSDVIKKDFVFVDQITRAVRSISANIAEGNDALTVPEFIAYLGYAKRSAAEVRSHLYDALDENYISMRELDELSNLTCKICSMLAKLMHHLQKLDVDRRRTLKRASNAVEKTNKQKNEQTVIAG